MTFSSFRYLIKEGFKGIVSNRMMSVAAILVLVACMLLIGGAFLFAENINSVLDFISDQTEMYVNLNDERDKLVDDQIENKLNELSAVETVTYIPKEEGFQDFLDTLGDKAHDLLKDMAESNPPADDAFLVKLNDTSQMREVQVLMENTNGVSDVTAPTTLADTLTNMKKMVNIAGVIIVLVLIIVSLVITANTIKLTVFNRRKEINIMKYVGAMDSFIRLPFIVEGILIGTIAAVISIFITWGYYSYIIKWVAEWDVGGMLTSAMGSLVQFKDIAYELVGYFLGGGIVVGVLSSSIFVKKHLKV